MTDLTEGVVRDWLDRYVQAWRTCDESDIGDLFTEDAIYRYSPGDEPLQGRDEIVASWQQDSDAPGSWEAEYLPWLVGANRAIAIGRTRYSDGSSYWNCFQLVFAGGRCSDFIEWYMTQQEGE